MTAALPTGLVLSWLLGSLPTAYLVGRAYGVDLRTVGSGNLGATNALRTLGWKAGLLVYAVDTLKGVLPVLLLPRLLPTVFGGVAHPHWGLAFGLAAIVGHVRPVFLRGKGGGKGVATASGAFFALVPLPALFAFLTFVAVAAVSRYISLASLVGALVLVTAVGVQYGVRAPVFGFAALVAVFVFWTHRENIGRLRRGTERRLGERTATAKESADVADGTADAADDRREESADVADIADEILHGMRDEGSPPDSNPPSTRTSSAPSASSADSFSAPSVSSVDSVAVPPMPRDS